MKSNSTNYSYFTIITNEGRFLNFTSDRILSFYHIELILKQLNIQYERCYIIDPITSTLIDLNLDMNLKIPIPPHSRIVALNISDYELLSNLKNPPQISSTLSSIELPNGKFISKSPIPELIKKNLSKIQKIYNTDLHSKIKSVVKTMCQNREDLNPDISFFELAKVSNDATIERRKLIENDPLLQSIMICEPTTEFEHRKLLIEVKVAFNAEETDCLINKFVIQINSDQFADEVIEYILEQKVRRYFPDKKLLASDCALQIPGTDEIFAGKYPLSHFIFIQKYLDSTQKTLKLNLIKTNSNFVPISPHKRTNSSIENSKSTYRSDSTHSIENIENYLNNYFACKNEIIKFEKTSKRVIIPHTKIKTNFSVIIEGFRFPKNNKQNYKVHVLLCVGSSVIQKIKLPKILYELNYSSFGLRVDFKLMISQLPRYTKLVIKLTNKLKKKTDTFGFASFPLFDRNGKLLSGRVKLDFIFSNTFPNNPSPPPSPKSQVEAFLRFQDYPRPVYYQDYELSEEETANFESKLEEAKTKSEKFNLKFKKMKIPSSPLQKLTDEQKTFLIDNRWNLTQFSEYLPTYLRSFKRWNNELTNELPLLLNAWAKPDKSTTILLLSGEFYDPVIRSYVVKNLETWSGADLSLFMLQIVRSLEFEHDNDSELGKFLLRRASLEPKYLGLQLFWQLKALSDIPWMHRRVMWMNGALVAFSDLHEKFLFSYYFIESLFRICKEKKIKHGKIGEELPLLSVDAYTQLPIDPKLIVKNYVIPECFFADSSKRPLILSFKPADPFCTDNIKMMIKVNDDLRQDMITMQILNVMDQLWKREGLNMRMKIYSVLATGDNQGIIEIVPNSVTISSIQKQKGKLRGVRQNDTISEWLEKAARDNGIRKEIQIQNFTYSMACYVVATYVLGIGDRHCSNMMIQKDGHFFHIDFGHFLGHFKTFIGIDRESNMFYFSDAFVHVLGGFESQTYSEFEALCCKAFCIIRKNHNILITLLYLMKNTGIPELSSVDDIKYVENALMLNLSDDEACQKLRDMLKLVPTLKITAVSDFCHQIQH